MTTMPTVFLKPLSLFSVRRVSVAGKISEEVEPPTMAVALAVAGGGIAMLPLVVFYVI